jgi:hypothetical protein
VRAVWSKKDHYYNDIVACEDARTLMPDDFTSLSGEELIGRLGELLGREAALQQAATAAREACRQMQAVMVDQMKAWRACRSQIKALVDELRCRHGVDVKVEPL